MPDSTGASTSTSWASTTTKNGALMPSPKPSASRSADLRWVVSRLDRVSFGRDSCRSSAGPVSAPKPRITRAMVIAGNFVTTRIHLRKKRVDSCSRPFLSDDAAGLSAAIEATSSSSWRSEELARSASERVRLNNRRPLNDNRAGTNVSATNTAAPTVKAAAKPM